MGMIDDMAELLNKFDVPFVQDGSRLYYPDGKIARATIRYHWDKDIFSVGGMISFYGKMGDIVIALENDWSIIKLKEQVAQLEKEVERLRLGQARLARIIQEVYAIIKKDMGKQEIHEIAEFTKVLNLTLDELE